MFAFKFPYTFAYYVLFKYKNYSLIQITNEILTEKFKLHVFLPKICFISIFFYFTIQTVVIGITDTITNT